MTTFITFVVCATIVVLGMMTLRSIRSARRAANRRIDALRTVFADVPHPVSSNYRTLMLSRAEAHGDDVEHLWHEYNETLVGGRGGELLNTVDAEHYFRSDTLAPELLHDRTISGRSSILTVLGVLGTFLGLTFGLEGIDLSGSADQLTEGVRVLISGASTAFLTSVFGVTASLIVQAAEKRASGKIEAAIQSLQIDLDHLFEKQTSEASLVAIMNSSEASQEHLAVLGEQIGAKLQQTVGTLAGDLRESVDHMQRSVEEAITTTIAPEMERIATLAANQSADIFEGLVDKFAGRFEQIGVTLADRLDAASATMSTTLDYLGERMAQQADEHHERMSEIRSATQRQVELLDTHLPDVIERLDDAVARLDTVSVQLTPASENLRVTADAFERTSTGFRDVLSDSTESFERITDQHARAAETVSELTGRLENLTSSTTAASAMLEEASVTLRDGLSGMREQQEQSYAAAQAQQQAFLEGLRSHQAQVLDKLAAEIDGFRTSLTAWFVDYSNAVKEQTDSRMNEWNEHTHAYTSTMLDAARALSAAVEDIEGVLLGTDPDGGDQTRKVAA